MNKPAPAPFDFSFARAGGRTLVTNCFGASERLSPAGFRAFAAGRARGADLERLGAGGFIAGRMDFEGLAAGLGASLLPGWRGPHVHILELTRRCNAACSYCGASATGRGGPGPVMSRATARAALAFIFAVETPSLMLEFQGGEPLLNFPVLQYLVREASARAAVAGRKVNFSVVTNLALMDEEKFRFLLANRVAICSSLDGPALLHDACRGRGAHAPAARWLKRAAAEARRDPALDAPNAICTVTRRSLPRAAAIVDEFVRLGLRRVQLGPLEPLGRARSGWAALAPSPAEFAGFYREALGHMLALNRRGVPVYEKGALQFFRHRLDRRRPRYQNLDLAFRLCYAADGSVFGSDEARLLYNQGDDLFRLGSVQSGTFRGLLGKPLARALLLSDFPALSQPHCARCAWAPWCRVSPAQHYAAQGSFWGNLPSSPRCAMYKAVFAALEELGSAPRNMAIFKKWSETYA